MVALSNPRVHTIGSYVSDYDSADKFLTRGGKPIYERTLTGNTVVRRVMLSGYYGGAGASEIAVWYHKTPIVTYRQDGIITLNTGGWKTKTTMERMNELLPGGFRIEGGIQTRRGDYSQKRPWKIRAPGGETAEFFDGIMLRGMPSTSYKFLKDQPSGSPIFSSPRKNPARKKNPGKFDNTVEEMLYSTEHDQQVGSVFENGYWYGLVSGMTLPEAWDVVETLGIDPTEFKEDAEQYDWPLNAIISEDSQGFVEVFTFKNNRDAMASWRKVERDFG